MTKPIDQATIQAIDALTKQIADLMEKLNAAHEEVSLHESQQDVMAADMVKLMDQIEYQKKAAKKDYDRIKKLEFRLKQERNKAIDDVIEAMNNLVQFGWIERPIEEIRSELAFLKDKSHE